MKRYKIMPKYDDGSEGYYLEEAADGQWAKADEAQAEIARLRLELDDHKRTIADAAHVIRAFADHNYWWKDEDGSWELAEYDANSPPYVNPQLWLIMHGYAGAQAPDVIPEEGKDE